MRVVHVCQKCGHTLGHIAGPAEDVTFGLGLDPMATGDTGTICPRCGGKVMAKKETAPDPLGLGVEGFGYRARKSPAQYNFSAGRMVPVVLVTMFILFIASIGLAIALAQPPDAAKWDESQKKELSKKVVKFGARLGIWAAGAGLLVALLAMGATQSGIEAAREHNAQTQRNMLAANTIHTMFWGMIAGAVVWGWLGGKFAPVGLLLRGGVARWVFAAVLGLAAGFAGQRALIRAATFRFSR